MKTILCLLFLMNSSAFAYGLGDYPEYKLKFQTIENGVEVDPSVVLSDILFDYDSHTNSYFCTTGGGFEPTYPKHKGQLEKIGSDGLLTLKSSFRKGLARCNYVLSAAGHSAHAVDSQARKFFIYMDFFLGLTGRYVGSKFVEGDFRGAKVTIKCQDLDGWLKCEAKNIDYDHISPDKVTTVEIHLN